MERKILVFALLTVMGIASFETLAPSQVRSTSKLVLTSSSALPANREASFSLFNAAPRFVKPTVELSLLKAQGSAFRDEGAKTVVLRGSNYRWFEGVDKGHPSSVIFDKIAGLGMNFVRIPINWYFIEPTPGFIDWGYIADIKAAVEMARDRGLYVMIDFHQYFVAQCFTHSYGDGFPTWFVDSIIGSCQEKNNPAGVMEFWLKFWQNPVLTSKAGSYAGQKAWDVLTKPWRHVVWALRNFNNVVGWDVFNEPMPGQGDAAYVNNLNQNVLPSFYETVVSQIRLSDWRDGDYKNHVAILEGGAGSALRKPNIANIALSPHLYPMYSAADWFTCQYLSANVGQWRAIAARWPAPLLVGEYGANTSGGDGCNFQFMSYMTRVMSATQTSFSWWEVNPAESVGYSLLNASLAYKPGAIYIKNNLTTLPGSEQCTGDLVNQRPVGYLDGANPNAIFGWSCDGNTPDRQVTVQIFLNNVLRKELVATIERPDLVQANLLQCSGPQHGFHWQPTGIAPGTYTVTAFATDIPNGTRTQLTGIKTLTIPTSCSE